MSIASDWTIGADAIECTSDRAERALLGVLLLVGDSGLERCAKLRSDDFRSPQRGAVLTAMRRLAFVQAPIDAITVTDELERKRVQHPPETPGWATVLCELLDDGTVGAADDDSIAAYARIVTDAAALRRRAAWVA